MREEKEGLNGSTSSGEEGQTGFIHDIRQFVKTCSLRSLSVIVLCAREKRSSITKRPTWDVCLPDNSGE